MFDRRRFSSCTLPLDSSLIFSGRDFPLTALNAPFVFVPMPMDMVTGSSSLAFLLLNEDCLSCDFLDIKFFKLDTEIELEPESFFSGFELEPEGQLLTER